MMEWNSEAELAAMVRHHLDRPIDIVPEFEWEQRELGHQRRMDDLLEMYAVDVHLDDRHGDTATLLARRAVLAAQLSEIYDPIEHGRKLQTQDGRMADPATEDMPIGWVLLQRIAQSRQLELLSHRLLTGRP